MKDKLTKLYSFFKDNDLTQMMKNTTIGYSLKKVIALILLGEFRICNVTAIISSIAAS